MNNILATLPDTEIDIFPVGFVSPESGAIVPKFLDYYAVNNVASLIVPYSEPRMPLATLSKATSPLPLIYIKRSRERAAKSEILGFETFRPDWSLWLTWRLV